MIKEIAFSSFRVTDMARAREFYEGQLGLPLTQNYKDVWVEYEVAGATFAIQTVSEEPPSGHRGLVAFEVDDLDAEVARLKAAGVRMAMEKIESPVCWMAIVNDPDGNPICLHQRKPTT